MYCVFEDENILHCGREEKMKKVIAILMSFMLLCLSIPTRALAADMDTKELTELEGTEVTLHANYPGANPATKKVYADKDGNVLITPNMFPERAKNMVIGSWSTAEDWLDGESFSVWDDDSLIPITDYTGTKIYTDLYAQWSYKKNITFKDNSGKVIGAQVISSEHGEKRFNDPIFFEPNFEGTEGKMVVGFTTKPNGEGDYYLPFTDHRLKVVDVPDVLYVQEIPIPNYDYLFFIPNTEKIAEMGGRTGEQEYSAADIAKLDKKYVVVKHAAESVMPSATVFGGDMKVTYWYAMSFDWDQKYEPGTSVLEYSRLVANKAGSRPMGYPFVILGYTNKTPGENLFETTIVHNSDGSRETITIRKSDNSVITLKEYRDGSAEGTSIMRNGATASTAISRSGEIIVDVTTPSGDSDLVDGGIWEIPEEAEDHAIVISLPKSKLRNRVFYYEFLDNGSWHDVTGVHGEPQAHNTLRFFAPNYRNCKLKVVPDVEPLTDIPLEIWYSDSVEFVTNRGLFYGTSNTAFSPDTMMNRGMFSAVLWRLENEPPGAGRIFEDVASSAYYASAASWANAGKIIEGVGSGRFAPNREITREEIATMLYRYANYIGIDTNTQNAELNFVDSDKISSWAEEAMEWTVQNEIIQGMGNERVNPKGKATRAQVATIMQRFVEAFI